MEDYGFMELEQKKAFLIKFCYWGVIALCTLKCIVSYGLIFLITFIELWAGLAIIKVPYAMTAAVVIAVLDILPVLGAGSVLIPWGIFAALNGDFKMAVDNEYLTIENILSFPINSVTLAVLLVLFVCMAVYTMIDIGAVIFLLDQSYQGKKLIWCRPWDMLSVMRSGCSRGKIY